MRVSIKPFLSRIVQHWSTVFSLTALTFACIFAMHSAAIAEPSDLGAKPKEVKEPKEIKDAATASKDVKDAIKNAKKKKDCMKECGTAYDPICAHDPANTSTKPRSFGTLCAMEIHNCEMGTSKIFTYPSLSSHEIRRMQL